MEWTNCHKIVESTGTASSSYHIIVCSTLCFIMKQTTASSLVSKILKVYSDVELMGVIF
jgi:hypothetical protein